LFFLPIPISLLLLLGNITPLASTNPNPRHTPPTQLYHSLPNSKGRERAEVVEQIDKSVREYR
jgi:hypothetical protein